MSTYDVIVIGAGSGGMGAAITAARNGMKVLWIEKDKMLGGTGVNAWVCMWQPAYSVSPLAREIGEKLIATGGARYNSQTGTRANYDDTLRRWANLKNRLHAPHFIYIPERMDEMIRSLVAETGNVTILAESTFLECSTNNGNISSIAVKTPAGVQKFSAPFFIDATCDIDLARSAGCAWDIGRESRSQYNEPSAPENREFKLNGWTLCFMIEKGSENLFSGPAVGIVNKWSCIDELGDGRIVLNTCLQLPGEEGFIMGEARAREFLEKNIRSRWPLIKEHYNLHEYAVTAMAPQIGRREGPRLMGEYVMTENDVVQGSFGRHHDDCIAFSDHAMDLHAPDRGCAEMPNGPFGVPFRCLQPREIKNLLVASRGASVSSIACSAFRLQRTMIELGEAAGYFAATGKVLKPGLPSYKKPDDCIVAAESHC